MSGTSTTASLNFGDQTPAERRKQVSWRRVSDGGQKHVALRRRARDKIGWVERCKTEERGEREVMVMDEQMVSV